MVHNQIQKVDSWLCKLPYLQSIVTRAPSHVYLLYVAHIAGSSFHHNFRPFFDVRQECMGPQLLLTLRDPTKSFIK